MAGLKPCDHRNGVARHNDAAALRAGLVTIPPYGVTPLVVDGEIRWDTEPADDRSWYMWLHSLQWVEKLHETYAAHGEAADLEAAVRYVRSWVDNHPLRPTNEGPWHDHATSMRALTLVCLRSLGVSEEWLSDAIRVHGEVMRDERRYAGPYNHGISQDLSLIAVGSAIGEREWVDFAAARLIEVAHTSISPDGVLDEQAPEYSNYLWSLWSRAVDDLIGVGHDVPDELTRRLAEMPTFMAHATQPDGRYVQFGDSFHRQPALIPGSATEYVRTGGASGKKPESTVRVYDEGYAFGRSGWGEDRPLAEESHYAVRFGPARYRHGHDDHMSFVYVADGREIVSDSGHCNYQRDSYRAHLISSSAHNVVEAIGQQIDGSAATELVASRYDGPVHTLELRDQPYSGVTRTRQLTFLVDWDVVLVHDVVAGASVRRYRQLTHLSPELEIRRDGPKAVIGTWRDGTPGEVRVDELLNRDAPHPAQLVTGAVAPLLGWVSREVDERVPGPVVVYETLGQVVELLTVVGCGRGAGVVAEVTSEGDSRSVTLTLEAEQRTVQVLDRPRESRRTRRDRTWHDAEEDSLPEAAWGSLGDVDFTIDAAQPVLHRIDGEGLPLYAYFRQGGDEVLNVAFHGAVDRKVKPVPHLEWLRMSRDMPGSVLLLPDPTLFVDEHLELGWYLGSEHYDPEPALRRLVQQAKEASGAKDVVFMGTSGGGFCALRFGGLFPGSSVLAINPQVDLFQYYHSWLAKILKHAYPSYDRATAQATFADRWSALPFYADGYAPSRVLYVQNSQDPHHLFNHLRVFREAAGIGADERSIDGAIRLMSGAFGAGHVGPARETTWSYYLMALDALRRRAIE